MIVSYCYSVARIVIARMHFRKTLDASKASSLGCKPRLREVGYVLVLPDLDVFTLDAWQDDLLVASNIFVAAILIFILILITFLILESGSLDNGVK
jgi:hypothetical protein